MKIVILFIFFITIFHYVFLSEANKKIYIYSASKFNKDDAFRMICFQPISSRHVEREPKMGLSAKNVANRIQTSDPIVWKIEKLLMGRFYEKKLWATYTLTAAIEFVCELRLICIF